MDIFPVRNFLIIHKLYNRRGGSPVTTYHEVVNNMQPGSKYLSLGLVIHFFRIIRMLLLDNT